MEFPIQMLPQKHIKKYLGQIMISYQYLQQTKGDLVVSMLNLCSFNYSCIPNAIALRKKQL